MSSKQGRLDIIIHAIVVKQKIITKLKVIGRYVPY
jgi:hypothetical protein